MRLPAMFVCLSVCLTFSKITQNFVHGFGWNFACRQVSGHGRTDQLLSPNRIIVRMPEPENLKVEDLSKSVKQAPHPEQATGHGMHCREILFTPRSSPRAREFPDRSTFLCDVRLRSYGASNLPNFRILAFVEGTECPSSYECNFMKFFEAVDLGTRNSLLDFRVICVCMPTTADICMVTHQDYFYASAGYAQRRLCYYVSLCRVVPMSRANVAISFASREYWTDFDEICGR